MASTPGLLSRDDALKQGAPAPQKASRRRLFRNVPVYLAISPFYILFTILGCSLWASHCTWLSRAGMGLAQCNMLA